VPIPTCGIAIGFLISVLLGDPNSATHVHVRFALVATGQFLIIMAALSISINWLDMVDAAKIGGQRRHSSSSANIQDSTRSTSETGKSYSKKVLPATFLLSVITGAFLIAMSNLLLVSLILMGAMPVVAASFIVASNRIHVALNRVLPCDDSISIKMSLNLTVPPAVQTMAKQVRLAARGIGARCVGISIMGFGYGLCRPSPNPVYVQQNSLPPWLSGQIAIYLLGSLTIETSTYIASYLNYWVDRHECSAIIDRSQVNDTI